MSKMSSPAYLMYPGDILSSGRVAALKPLEELWYRRAIDLGWEPGGMPADPAEFAGWVGRGCTAESAKKIIDKFYEPHKKDVSMVVQPRQEIERKKFIKKSKERSKAGIESGRKRRERRRLADEQLFNKDGTKTNTPIPISFPIPIPIPKEDFKRLIGMCTRENSKIDPKIVEIGVLYTMLQRNGSTEPIRSVKYFEPEIKKIAQDSKGMGAETIDAVLERRREQFWKDRTAERSEC